MKYKIKRITAVISALVILITCISCFSVNAIVYEGDYVYGDIDRDNTISIIDATYIQMMISELKATPEDILYYGDLDCNLVINIKDATIIQKYVVELYNELPINPPVLIPETRPVEPTIENSTTEPTTEASTSNIKATEADHWQNQVIKP